MSLKAGSAYIELEGKDKGAMKLLNQVEKKTGNIKKGLSGLTKAFIALGGALVVKDIVQTFAKFEQSVANAASVTGAFGDQLIRTKKNISDVAKELGKTTVFSANEAASALYDLASAGEDVANITKQDIKPILDLAAATGTTLPRAMEQTLASMKQMGLGFEDVGAITDSLMATIASSPANMERLRTAWKQAAPIAHTLGVNFNELNAALGTLFKKGFLQGEQAGTALRNMFTRLVPTTQTQRDNLKELGLATSDVSVEQHGLLGVLKNLNGAFGNLENKTAKVAAAKKMFGEEAAGAAIALIEEAENAQKLYDSMELMKSKAEETGVSLTEMVAELQLDTLQGSMKLFTSNLESLKIAIGEVLAPMIRRVAELMGSIAANEEFQKFMQATFILISDTISKIITMFTIWSTAINQAFGGDSTQIVENLARAFEIVGNAVSIAIGYITEFGVFVIKTLAKIGKVFEKLWGKDIKEMFGYAIQIFIGLVAVFVKGYELIVSAWGKLSPFFTQMLDGIIKFVKGFMQVLTGDFVGGFSNIIKGVISFGVGLVNILVEVGTAIGKFMVKTMKFIFRTIVNVGKLLGAFFVDLVLYLGGLLGKLLADIVIFADKMIDNFLSIDWADVWSGMGEWFGNVLDNVVKKAKEMGSKIMSFFKDMFSGKDSILEGSGKIGSVSGSGKSNGAKDFDFGQIDPFDFSNSKKVLAEIGSDFNSTFFNIDTSKIEKEASKIQEKLMSKSTLSNGNTMGEQQDILDTLNSQNQSIEEQEKAIIEKNKASASGGAAGAKMSEAEKEAAEEKKESDKKTISNYKIIGEKITDSIKRIQKYGDNLENLKKKFLELKKSALGDINELSNSITSLDEQMKKISDLGEEERGNIESDGDIALSERRLEILERQKEVDKEIRDLKHSDDGDKYVQINDLKKEEKSLGKELYLINKSVSQEILKQVEVLNSKNKAERILLETARKIAVQREKEKEGIDKLKSEKASLVEKKAIAQAILDDKKIKLVEEGEMLKAFYIDQNGKEVEIKDFKNIQYAQDMENKRLTIQSQLLAVEEGILKEQEILAGFYEKKTTMEKEFTTVLQEEKAKQKIEIDKEISQTRKAIKVWNEYWRAKKKGKGNASVGLDTQSYKGFKGGGYTGDAGVNEVAGLVHGKEYVIPHKVMQKLGGTGILNGLERLRKGFAGGGHTSSIPTVSNVNSPSLNVTQHIASGLDFQGSIQEMGYLLRLRG